MQTVDQIGKSKKTTRLFPQSGTVRIAHVGREAQSLEGSLFGTLGAQSCGTSLLLLTVVLFYAFPQVAKFVLENFLTTALDSLENSYTASEASLRARSWQCLKL